MTISPVDGEHAQKTREAILVVDSSAALLYLNETEAGS